MIRSISSDTVNSFAHPGERLGQGRAHGPGPNDLTAALAWLIANRETEDAVQLIESIWRVWRVRGPLRDGQTWTEKVLALKGVERSPDFGWLLVLAAEFPRFRGDHARAQALLERSVEVLTRSGEKFRLAKCVGSLAGVFERQGKPERAEALHEQCLAIGRELNEPGTIVQGLNGLAVRAFRKGDYARMTALAEEELTLNRKVGSYLCESLHNVAEARRHLGQLGSAAQAYIEGLGLSLDLGDITLIAEFFDGLADTAAARGDFESATLLWAASGRLLDETQRLTWNAPEAERGLAAARADLGPAKFGEAWRAGQALSRDEAVALANRIAADARGAVPL